MSQHWRSLEPGGPQQFTEEATGELCNAALACKVEFVDIKWSFTGRGQPRIQACLSFRPKTQCPGADKRFRMVQSTRGCVFAREDFIGLAQIAGSAYFRQPGLGFYQGCHGGVQVVAPDKRTAIGEDFRVEPVSAGRLRMANRSAGIICRRYQQSIRDKEVSILHFPESEVSQLMGKHRIQLRAFERRK